MNNKELRNKLINFWETKFDHIYLQHWYGYDERLDDMISELKRVGIYYAKNFSIYYSIENQYEDSLYEKLKNENKLCEDIVSLNKFRGSYTFYKILCESYALNYKNTIIIHDDIRFIKDLNLLYDILVNLPDDYDLCMFDYLNVVDKYESVSYDNFINADGGYVNKYYLKWYDFVANTISAMSQRFVKFLLNNMNLKFGGSDIYIYKRHTNIRSYDLNELDNYNCIGCIPRLAIQCDYTNSLVNEVFGNSFINKYTNKHNQYVFHPIKILNDVDFSLYNAYDNFIKYNEYE